MSDYDTGNPVPSIDPRDLDDNATVFDRLLNGPDASYADRLGVQRKSWQQMEDDAAALVAPNVAALAAVTAAADKGVFFNAATPVGMGTYTLTSFVRGLGVSANEAAFRTGIGAISSSDSITGSAATLTTPRSLSASGDATWTVSFNGSTNVTAALTLAASGVGAGTYGSVTVNTKGLVTAATAITPVANGGTGIATQTFVNLTLANSWTVLASRRAGYQKITDKSMYLEIQISGGTATDGTTVATLPAGFRPPNDMNIPCSSGPNATPSSTVRVPSIRIAATTGVITCDNCSSVPGILYAGTIILA